MIKTILKGVAGLVLVAVCAAAGLYGAEYLFDDGESGSADRRGGPTQVAVRQPETRLIEEAVSTVGTLMPSRSVALVPAATGRVTEVYVDSSAVVEEGAPILQIDARAAEADLSEAQATLTEARQDLRRFERLVEENTVAETRLEEARARYERAQAAVERAQSRLDDHRLVAPFAGTLSLIDIEPGTFIESPSPVTRLSDLTPMELSATLPEKYFARLSPGQEVVVRVPAYPDRSFGGTVTTRATEIDEATRSFTFRAEIENDDDRLVGGMFASTRLVFDTYEGLAVPDDAIVSEGLTSFVYKVSDGVAQRTEVTLGASLGDLTEVTEGLESDARVVVAGWDRLSDGAEVEVTDDVAPGALE